MLKIIPYKALILILITGPLYMPLQAQAPVDQSALRFQETIWLNSDRSIYLAGEQIHYHVALFEKDTYKPSVLSRAVRVELMDQEGNRVCQQNVLLIHSKVFSNMPVPAVTKSGWYYLRAYTNWMRNFSVSDFSVLPVKIVNPAGLASIALVKPEYENTTPVEPVNPHHASNLQIRETTGQLQVQMTGSELPDHTKTKMLVHRSYTWYWFDRKSIDNGTLTFSIPKKNIPSGIVQISILNDENKILARKLWSGDHPGNQSITITQSQTHYPIRRQANFNYTLPDKFFKKTASGLQILVALKEPGTTNTNYIPGLPGWSFNAQIPAEKTAFERWMQNHHYPDETVKGFFNTTTPAYFPETKAGILSGRVINQSTGQGVASVTLGLTILNDNSFDATTTNKEGIFIFSFPDVTEPRDYILTFTTEPNPDWIIKVTPQYDTRVNKMIQPEFSLTPNELEYIKNREIDLQLKTIYNPGKTVVPVKPVLLPKKKTFFSPPERVIHIDDYIKLANMREIIFEVVPDVYIRKKGANYSIHVYPQNSIGDGYKTLVLLDGIPFTRHNELMDLPPDRIRTIELKNKLYIHGDGIFSSIVNFISRNFDYAGLDLPPYAILSTVDLPKPSGTSIFAVPVLKVPTLPMLDPILLWKEGQPSSTHHVQFTVQDKPGKYWISVFGFDETGKWWSGKSGFIVR
ncbi:MAG: hypothetical protein J7L89_10300 [Bacteroidales bacterium]|nr:hypothetical protein [Bacteroidales bacterium]